MLRNLIIALVFCISSAAIADNAIAASSGDAHQFVDNLGKQVVDTLNDSSKTDPQKKSQLQQMFLGNVDVPWMGRFVLGSGWKQATEAQQKRYLDVYQQYMVAHYTKNFSDYTNSNYTITDVQNENEGQFTVNMQIKTPNQTENTKAGYRLRPEKSNGFKIVDIIVEGVSLVITQRSEFGSVIKQKGMDGLITTIENKITTDASSVRAKK